MPLEWSYLAPALDYRSGPGARYTNSGNIYETLIDILYKEQWQIVTRGKPWGEIM